MLSGTDCQKLLVSHGMLAGDDGALNLPTCQFVVDMAHLGERNTSPNTFIDTALIFHIALLHHK